ncbi:hypothetical protein GH714_011485 [Hevea brasiliensis]|uniref:F-box domain-containing protein n=1 Tax=Hevea brasiliensis TaxID=3981 RepID=A0A6A6NGP5_HEVBR|nr:hypothetical protein GH714_011485 [Hevea brasiliensis]
MWREIRDREAEKPALIPSPIELNQTGSLISSSLIARTSSHLTEDPINSLQVDLTEGRYLLSGASDASAACFDIQRATDYEGRGLIAKHKCLFAVDKQHESGHKFAISSAIWYPVDTGLFITGSYDHYIKSGILIPLRWCYDSGMVNFKSISSQLGRRPPILACSATNKVSISKALSAGQNLPSKPRVHQKKSAAGNGIKQSPLGRTPAKGPLRQRLHPGMLSSQDRATAHYGAVTGLKITEDGMYLLSAGSDSRMRLWDVESGCNTLVNFETVRLQTSKAIQLATTQDSSLVFVPCMTAVKEIYTGGNDRQILVWSPSRLIANEMLQKNPIKPNAPVSPLKIRERAVMPYTPIPAILSEMDPGIWSRLPEELLDLVLSLLPLKTFLNLRSTSFIYDSRFNSWQKFDNLEPILSDNCHQEGVFFNGSLYFTTPEPFSIVCLDMERKVEEI